MTRFTTESGSVYELDEEGQRVRRLSGSAPPTPRQGIDGEWREFLDFVLVETGGRRRMYFLWSVDDDETYRGTITNAITSQETI